jgi:membrane-associated phospholipid phosphatase
MPEVPEGGIRPILNRLMMTEQSEVVVVPGRVGQPFRSSTWVLILVAVVGSIVAFWALAQLDPLFRDAIAPWRTPAFVLIMNGVTMLGEGWLIGAVALVMAWIAHRVGRRDLVRAGLVAVPALIASGLIARVFKILVGRARPGAVAEGFGHWAPSFSAAYNSFPSGHATSAFTMAAILAVVAPRWRAVFYVVAAVVGFSRVAVDAHYLSDVVGGGLLGWATGRLAMGIAERRRPAGAEARGE